jgi:hypothetical protein
MLVIIYRPADPNHLEGVRRWRPDERFRRGTSRWIGSAVVPEQVAAALAELVGYGKRGSL